jgi:hypothetical protein
MWMKFDMTSDFLVCFQLNATLPVHIEPSEHFDIEQISQINLSMSSISFAVQTVISL